MAIKSNVTNATASHPRLVILAIALGITMAMGGTIGMLDHQQALSALAKSSSVPSNPPFQVADRDLGLAFDLRQIH